MSTPSSNTIHGIPTLPSVPWNPRTFYSVGAQVTPTNPVGFDAVGLIFHVYQCLQAGVSGDVAPDWPKKMSVEFWDSEILWINAGLYLP